MNNRLLQSQDLPEALWSSSDGALVLPDALAEVYKQLLKDKGLYEEALNNDSDDGPVGGIKKADTEKHFASRFSGSAARTQLSILDPHNELGNASDLFVKAFSGGTVGLLDVPSGAGAASLDLLLTVATLREHNTIPRQPLTVKLVSGDISEHARSYASEMLEEVKSTLNKQGIFVDEVSVYWDVCDADSTTGVLHEWMKHAPDCREYFVVMANFSGFLQSQGKFESAKAQLEEVIRWAGQRRSTVLWLEPQTNIVAESFIPRVWNWFSSKLPNTFRCLWDSTADVLKSHCRFLHPIKDGIPRVHLTLIRLEATE